MYTVAADRLQITINVIRATLLHCATYIAIGTAVINSNDPIDRIK